MTVRARVLPWEQRGACDVSRTQQGAVNFPPFSTHDPPLPLC